MIYQSVLIVSIYCVVCSGFLLDDRTTPQTLISAGTADHRYNALVNLLIAEREDRVKLEQEVSLLRKELLATQRGVTDLYHSHNKLNGTYDQQSVALKSLEEKYISLQNKYDSLQTEMDTVKGEYVVCTNMTSAFQNELKTLKHLQSISDLQSELALQNRTNSIEKQVEASNTKLNQIQNDVNARKQDFIALFNKADATEQKVQLSVETLNQSQNALELALKAVESEQNNQQSQLQISLNSTSQHFQQKLDHLQSEFSKQPNRVAVTACAAYGRYKLNSNIKFPTIQTSRGISSTVSSNLATTGTFTCEKTGLYLISVFITSMTDGGYVCLNKNGNIITEMTFSVNGDYQTNSFTVIYNLDINDQLTIQPCYIGSHVIAPSPYTCMSILQLTE